METITDPNYWSQVSMISVSETYRNKIETIQETKLLAALNDCTSNYQELLQSFGENCFKVLDLLDTQRLRAITYEGF